MDDFSRISQEEQIYSRNSLLCQQLGINYDINSINETKAQHVKGLELEALMTPRIPGSPIPLSQEYLYSLRDLISSS